MGSKKIIWIFIIIVAVVLSLVFATSNDSYGEASQAESPPRFRRIETFTFEGGNHSLCGHIYRDDETGIKYLFVHRVNEYATMTRLWEK